MEVLPESVEVSSPLGGPLSRCISRRIEDTWWCYSMTAFGMPKTLCPNLVAVTINNVSVTMKEFLGLLRLVLPLVHSETSKF